MRVFTQTVQGPVFKSEIITSCIICLCQWLIPARGYLLDMPFVTGAINILRELGFAINLEKSFLTTTQTMVFLGFVISN